VQQPSNTALATAITSEERVIRHQFLVDWNNDGNFSHAYSDLSAIVESIGVDRDITGDIPEEVNLIEGYSKAKLSVTLSGTRNDGELPAHKLLNPEQTNSPLYLTDITGLHVKWFIIVSTSAGDVSLQQFFGPVNICDVKRSAQTVEITAYDITDDLAGGVTVPRFAIDGVLSQTVGVDALKQNVTGLIDYFLRRNFFFCTPALHPDVRASWTLNGWSVPEIGTQIPLRTVDTGVKPAICAPWIRSNMSWAGNSHTGLNQYWSGQVTNGLPMIPSAYNTNPVTLGMGGWFYGPGGAADGVAANKEVMATRFDSTDSYKATLLLDPTLGPTVTLVNPTGAYSRTWTFPSWVWPTRQWNYIAVALSFSATGVQCRLNFNGTVTLHGTTAPVYPAIPAFNAILSPQLMSYSTASWPAHSLQVWWSNVATGSLQWTQNVPTGLLRPNTVLDLSDNYLTYIPDLIGVDTWQTLQAIVQADFGMILADETGVIRYKKRTSLRLPSLPVRTITTDALKDLETVTNRASIRNLVTASIQSAKAWNQNIYSETTANQYDTQPGIAVAYYVPLSDVMWVDLSPTWLTGITTIPNGLKSGYWAVDPGSNGGVPPFVDVAHQPFVVAWTADQRTLGIYVDNTLNQTFMRFALDDGSPALLISGTKIVKDDPKLVAVQDTNSVNRWGTQVLDLGQSEWRQDSTAITAICTQVMTDLSANVPNMERLPVVGDPRLQLLDTVMLTDPQNPDDRILAIIRGISRSMTKDGGLTDNLNLRLVAPPGTWILGDSVRSVLGSTTRLA